MGWTKRWRRRLRALVRRDAVERELDEELAFHLEMETEKNLRAGMSPEEAQRRAVLEFGGVERHKEEVRDARWLGWLNGLSLDARLGARMLVKYPGLTLVGGVGMAVAIALGAVLDASSAAVGAPLPLDEGERIVAIEVWDAEINNQERRILHDFATWREELRSVESLGAYRTVSRNLIVPGGSAEPVPIAEMSASGFRIARVPPLLGRYLVDEDELEGGPAVVVLGYDLWQSRFAGDPNVVGREVRLGNAVHTVVGVMPEGFAFPVNQRLWVPLQPAPSDYEPRQGPPVQVFGRLAPGATLADVRAELTTLGRRAAAALPDTHRLLRPRALPYGPHLLDDMEGWEIPFTRALVTLLLLVICVNVAVLVYARTATRAGEITVRSALGASQRRIVTQFFAEALVLAGVAAAIGLAIAAFSLGRLEALMERLLAPLGGLPFWIDLSLSPSTVLYVVGLGALAAMIVGVVPALQATGARLQASLRALGGATGMRLGRTWTVLIVAQVAFAVAALPAAVYYAAEFLRHGIADPGFAAEEFLTTYVVMDRETPVGAEAGADPPAFETRYQERLDELARRLEAEPDVATGTFATQFPGDEPTVRVEIDGAASPAEAAPGHAVRFNRVDLGFFDAFDARVLAGRSFEPGDLAPAATPVVVNRRFVREILGEESPLGRRIRYAEGYRSGGVLRPPEGVAMESWYEIVGVVDDLPANEMEPGVPGARVYHPLAPGVYPVTLTLRTRGAPAAFAPRLREVAAAVDPALQLRELLPMGEMLRKLQGGMRMGALALGLLTGSVLLLSAAGIYALMSFTVTQRRREIGIRSALGAHPGRILAGLFSRAAAQLGLGVAVGLGVAILLDLLTEGALTGGAGRVVLPAVAAIMLSVGFLATLGPARRGLRIEPVEALREE